MQATSWKKTTNVI